MRATDKTIGQARASTVDEWADLNLGFIEVAAIVIVSIATIVLVCNESRRE